MRALAAFAEATLVSAAEFTVGLMAQPDPGNLDGHNSNLMIADLADPQFVRFFAAA